MGIDFGLKRVGFARCDENRILATPLCTVKTSSMRETIDKAAKLAEEVSATIIVTGLPLNLDGTESVQSGRVRAFAKNLAKVTGLNVELTDERLTTVEADEKLLESGILSADERKKKVDSMAAAIILQTYIDNLKNKEQLMENNTENEVEVFDDDEYITLYDDDGNPVKFYEIACVEYEGDMYALMRPVEPLEGLGDDEALIFRVREEDEENDIFEPVTDESLLEKVFDEYVKAVEEAEDACDCDCDDDCCCHGEHHDDDGECCHHHDDDCCHHHDGEHCKHHHDED